MEPKLRSAVSFSDCKWVGKGIDSETGVQLGRDGPRGSSNSAEAVDVFNTPDRISVHLGPANCSGGCKRPKFPSEASGEVLLEVSTYFVLSGPGRLLSELDL
jgi:hypothetical protein